MIVEFSSNDLFRYDLAKVQYLDIDLAFSFKDLFKEKVSSEVKDGYNHVKLSGTIGEDFSSEDLEKLFGDSSKFDKSKGVLLHINSPGGSLGEVIKCNGVLEELESSGVKITAYADEVAASGGYFLGAGRNGGFYIDKEAQVGSIGAISILPNKSRQLEKDGIDVHVFRSGEDKARVNSIEPLREEDKKRIQSNIDEAGMKFCNFVSNKRGVSIDTVVNLKGRMLKSNEALDIKLVDGIESLKNVIKNVQFKEIHVNNNNRLINEKTMESNNSLEDQLKRYQEENTRMKLEQKSLVMNKVKEYSENYTKVYGSACSPIFLKALEEASLTDIEQENKILQDKLMNLIKESQKMQISSASVGDIAKPVNLSNEIDEEAELEILQKAARDLNLNLTEEDIKLHSKVLRGKI